MSTTAVYTLPIDRMVTVDDRQYRVHSVQIIGTNDVYLRAWEANVPGSPTMGHTTITTFGEGALAGAWGTVASAHLPAELEAMEPGSGDRIRAVDQWLRARKGFAAWLVFEAFPWLTDAPHRIDGDEVWVSAQVLIAHEPEAESF